MVLVESCLNSEQVSLMRSNYLEKYILVLKQVVIIAKVVLIWSGLYSGTLLYLQSFFDEEDQKQYIYKEPKVTSLGELCDRLKTMYEGKYGKDNVKLIKDSKTVSMRNFIHIFIYFYVVYSLTELNIKVKSLISLRYSGLC